MAIDIHSMELHEVAHEEKGNIEITRVAGGWLYYYLFRKETIFVPRQDSQSPIPMIDIYGVESVLREIKDIMYQRTY